MERHGQGRAALQGVAGLLLCSLTDNPAAIGSGGTGFASFMAGLTNGGSINNLHHVDYFRNTYAFYAQDDWKIAPTLVLNLGLRYELFGPVSDRHNDVGNFDLTDPANPTIFVPKGQKAQLTRQSPRQSILTVFNWTDRPRSRSLRLKDLGLPVSSTMVATEVMDSNASFALEGGAIRLENQSPQSAVVIKLVDTAVAKSAPAVTARVPSQSKVGRP